MNLLNKEKIKINVLNLLTSTCHHLLHYKDNAQDSLKLFAYFLKEMSPNDSIFSNSKTLCYFIVTKVTLIFLLDKCLTKGNYTYCHS